jgi:DNA-binding transcriptional MocR family regulator
VVRILSRHLRDRGGASAGEKPISVQRLKEIPGFSIDRVAAAAEHDPDVLRLENLDTDLPPPSAAISATQSALVDDDANSYLPFTGKLRLKESVAHRLSAQTGRDYAPENVVITAGGTEGLLDALLATTDPGDEVVLTDPTYAGMISDHCRFSFKRISHDRLADRLGRWSVLNHQRHCPRSYLQRGRSERVCAGGRHRGVAIAAPRSGRLRGRMAKTS